jgi:hypothetical protein
VTKEREQVVNLKTARAARKAKPRDQSNNGASGVVLLDRKDPMRSVRELVAARFTDDRQRRLLHWYRDTFWLFRGGCYR